MGECNPRWHIRDDVRVGVAHAVIHLYTVDNVAGACRHGFGQRLGAPVTANTATAAAATKSRPVRDRITHVVIRLARFT